jgi:ATP-dependent Clp protease ATP-binding subunit ClpC
MSVNLKLTFTHIMIATREEARRLQHDFIGVDHLFMALCRLGGITEKLIRRQGIEPRMIRNEIRKSAHEEFIARYGINFHYTPRLRSILKPLNKDAAAEMTAEISEADLLNEILKEGESIPVRILKKHGVKIDDLITDIAASENSISEEVSPEVENESLKTLLHFGRDLTVLAKEGKLNEVIGRDEEMQHLERTLVRATKNNPVLLGEAGVGKTAVIEKLAYSIANNQVIEELQDKHIIEINMSLVTAGTSYRGAFEENLVKIINAAKDADVILVIDELHTIVGSGGPEGGLDASNILKPALGRGEISLIGATTKEEYRKYIEHDAALERRFQPVIVNEPSASDTLKILNGIKNRLQHHHDIVINDDAVQSAVDLSVRFLPNRRLPDKAIDLIDEACAYSRIIDATSDKNKQSTIVPITSKEIAYVMTEWTGLPVSELSSDQQNRLLELPAKLTEKVIGQDEAVQVVSKSIETALTGLRNENKPKAVLFFVGPTGVGKTQLAKTLAEFLFGSENEMIRLDMSEYHEHHQVSKLIGSPPGYIGHGEGGILTKRLKEKPYSIVLLDEVEKAHPDVFDIFLQLFDDGRLTDGEGQTVDGCSAIFIMTSNIGSELYDIENSIGFTSQTEDIIPDDAILHEVKKCFRPEFINRIDEMVVFKPLSKISLDKIVKNIEDEFKVDMNKKGIDISLSAEVFDYLTERGYQPMYGARPLRRIFEHLLVQPIAHQLIKGDISSGDRITISIKDDKVNISKV